MQEDLVLGPFSRCRWFLRVLSSGVGWRNSSELIPWSLVLCVSCHFQRPLPLTFVWRSWPVSIQLSERLCARCLHLSRWCRCTLCFLSSVLSPSHLAGPTLFESRRIRLKWTSDHLELVSLLTVSVIHVLTHLCLLLYAVWLLPFSWWSMV